MLNAISLTFNVITAILDIVVIVLAIKILRKK